MRILHCIPSLSGGGAERQLATLARGLCSAGVETHVAHVYSGPAFKESDWTGANCHRMNPRSNLDPRLGGMLWRIVQQTRPHIVQTWLTQMDVLGGIAAMGSGVPYILSERSSISAYGNSWRDLLRAQIGSRAACVVANSFSGLAYWLDKNPSELNRVIRNAVILDNSKTESDRQVIESAKDTNRILYAGRYVEVKNVLVLIEALALVLREYQNSRAELFGAGPQKHELMIRKAMFDARDQIHINDFTSNLFGELSTAAAFVSVSHFEGHPNTVIEAALAKCPLVVSDIQAHREFLTPDCATFVPCNSSRAIADGIKSVLMDQRGAREKADRAYRKVRRWTNQLMVDQHLRLYGELLPNTA